MRPQLKERWLNYIFKRKEKVAMSSKSTLVIKHAVITFRNFQGKKKGKFGKEGDRYFSVFLDGYDRRGNVFEDEERIPQYKLGSDWMGPNELIPILEKEKWPVSWYTPSDAPADYEPRPVLKIKLNYFDTSNPQRPRGGPKVWLEKKDGSLVPLDESSVEQLDRTWIDDAKIRVNPYNWEEERDGVANGRLTAQLKDLCIRPVEDTEEDDDFYDDYNLKASDEAPF